jgi:glutathione S-transferase
MSKTHILYAWPLSYYSGKARAYLRYKDIAHVEKPIRLWTFKAIKRKTGATVMPVVVTPQHEWLQDTSDIMDELERRHPQAPVLPATPRQRIAALLLEAWGDEFWLPTAMHYRWSFPENFEQLFQREGGDYLLPFAPRILKNRLIAAPAGQMRSFLPGLGVVPAQFALIESWTVAMLDALDAHFATLPYLLGTRPSYGDFGLIGPLYAHLGRDPYPRRVLIQPRPHLERWIARMQQPEQPRGGAFLPDDRVPDTLAPLFRSVFGEFWPFLEQSLVQVHHALPALPAGRGFPRSLGEIEFPLAGHNFKRRATPFSLWMAQRALDAYGALQAPQRAAVDTWLAGYGAGGALRLRIMPRLRRRALHVLPV